MRRSLLAAWLLGCGGAPASSGDAAAPSSRAASEPAAPGDPLLAQARTSIRGGVLPESVHAAIVGSDAPAHARARRLLLGFAAPPGAVAPAPTASTPVVPPLPTAADEATATPVAPAPAPTAAPAATAPRARPRVERLSLRADGGGASLTIGATSGVLVGVANQPEAGIVRLVLEGVEASSKVLAARPQITGARVRDVSAGPQSVRITLELEPGWRFVRVARTAGGARVVLDGP